MILIVTQTFAPAKGGMEIYLTGLADQLALAGHAVTVFADSAKENFLPQTPYTLKRFGGWRPFRRWKKRRAVAATFASQKIEGIFCDSWKSVESLPNNINAPVIVLAHGAECPPTPSRRKFQRIAQALSRSTSIIANSRFTAEAVRPFLPTPNDPRLTIVLPPINPMEPPSPQAQTEMRALIGARHPVISVLARLEPRKGIDCVIAALPALLARYPSLVFLVGGGGGDLERLKTLAQEKCVGEHVVFLGRIDADKKSALFANSDLFAMPVRRVGTSVEGFGSTYIEAGWFGVPSLGGKNCGAADAVSDGETGLLCDGENQDDITEKLFTLLRDDAVRSRFGQAAHHRAHNELQWPQVLPYFLAALNPKGEASV